MKGSGWIPKALSNFQQIVSVEVYINIFLSKVRVLSFKYQITLNASYINQELSLKAPILYEGSEIFYHYLRFNYDEVHTSLSFAFDPSK